MTDWCVYIIRVHSTGSLYIGVTGDIERRKYQHAEYIRRCVWELISVDLTYQRTKRRAVLKSFRKPYGAQPVHMAIAEQIRPLVKSGRPNASLRDHYVIEVMYKCSSRVAALEMEAHMISEQKGNLLCMNAQPINKIL